MLKIVLLHGKHRMDGTMLSKTYLKHSTFLVHNFTIATANIFFNLRKISQNGKQLRYSMPGTVGHSKGLVHDFKIAAKPTIFMIFGPPTRNAHF